MQAPELTLIVDGKGGRHPALAAQRPGAWELLMLESLPGPCCGAQMQTAVEAARAELVMYVPLQAQPQPFACESLPPGCFWQAEAPQRCGAALWVARRSDVLAIGGCHPLLAGPRQACLDLLGRLEADGVCPLPLPPEAVLWRDAPLPTTRWEQALLQARIAADTAGDAAVLVKHPWAVSRRDDPAALQLEPSLERKRRELRRQAFWTQLLDLPVVLLRSLPDGWCGEETERGFAVRPWHRCYWRLFRAPAAALEAALAQLLCLLR